MFTINVIVYIIAPVFALASSSALAFCSSAEGGASLPMPAAGSSELHCAQTRFSSSEKSGVAMGFIFFFVYGRSFHEVVRAKRGCGVR